MKKKRNRYTLPLGLSYAPREITMHMRVARQARSVLSLLLVVVLFAPPAATAQAKAAVVRDAGPIEPVTGYCTFTQTSGVPYGCDLVTVPAGKRLVLETISISFQGNSQTLAPSIIAG